jgi:hypothetical protein
MSEATQDFLLAETEGAKMREAWLRKEAKRVLRNNTKRLNDWLHSLGHNRYHNSVPLDDVNDALVAYGFDALELMLLCGREGQLHEAVGHDKWLTLTWYKMETGRYEVIAYVN